MNDRLKSFLIEIECPSGAKLVGDLSRMAHAMSLEFYVHKPAEWLPRGIAIPSDIYAYIREDEGRALNYIFGMPWESLLKVMDPHKASPGPKDHELWNTMQCVQLSGKGGPNPFLARVTPKVDESKRETPVELFQDIKGITERTLERLREGNIEGAVNLLSGLVTACDNFKLPEPAAGDGWGHAHTADTVEALLREGSAMLEGTDKHEQMFRDMDDKVKIESLTKLVLSLQESRGAQIKANQLHDQQIKALEQGMTHLQGEYMALLKSTQKLHRRLGVPMGAYMTDPDQPKGLQRTHDTLKGILQLAAKIQNDPVLAKFLA